MAGGGRVAFHQRSGHGLPPRGKQRERAGEGFRIRFWGSALPFATLRAAPSPKIGHPHRQSQSVRFCSNIYVQFCSNPDKELGQGNECQNLAGRITLTHRVTRPEFVTSASLFLCPHSSAIHFRF